MPLIKSGSKKAFSKNVEREMESGKPQAQSLAIAYDVKRRNGKKKKYAKGGMVNESAKSEHRPMPDERDKDAKMVSHNSSRKDNAQSGWTDSPTVKQAQKPSITPLSRPKIANGILKVRDRADAEAEEHMIESMAPDGYGNQPAKELDEEGARRQGPKISDMESEHSTHRKPYAKGGEVEASDYSHKSNKYEDDLLDIPPSEDEGESMAISHNEQDADKQNSNPLDMEREHSNGRRPYASGGSVQSGSKDMNYADGGIAHEMMDQPDEEAEMEHEDSIAAAIMAKKDRMKKILDSGSMDEDQAVKFYEGGQVEGSDESMADIMSNGKERPNAYYGHNEEILKENYMSDMEGVDQPMDSNEHGDDIDSDKHDMISQIRSKMNKQRQFKVR